MLTSLKLISLILYKNYLMKILLFGLLMLTFNLSIAQQVETDTKIYQLTEVDVKPFYETGEKGFLRFIMNNFRAPEKSVSGTMNAVFVVEKDGSISQIIIRNPLSVETEIEAKRIIAKSKKWNAAQLN